MSCGQACEETLEAKCQIQLAPDNTEVPPGSRFASGGRYSVDWRKVGLLAALIWSTILVILLIYVVVPSLPFDYDIVIGGWEVAILCVPYALNIIFCVSGAKARFKKRAIYV